MKHADLMKSVGSAAWGFRALELPAQLKLAAKYGMAYHELGIANADTDLSLDASDEVLEGVKALYKAHGIALTCAATGNDFTGEDAQVQAEKVVRVIEMCRKLGVEKLRIFLGFTPLSDMTEEKWQVLRACIDQVAEQAKAQGVTLCVETHGAVVPMLDGVKHIRSTSTQVGDLLRALGDTGIKIVYDPANLYAVEEDPVRFYEAVKDRVGYVHLKDFRVGAQGQQYPAALGEGGTCWGPLREELLALNVPLLMEYEICEDLESGLQRCINAWKGETNQ